MKSFIALAVSLTSSLVLSASAQTIPAPAQAHASAAPTKVAVIAFQAAIAQTNEGQRNIGDLQKKLDPKRQQLKARSAELEALAKQLQSQESTLSDTERASRTKAIGAKKKDFDRDAEDAQNDYKTEMGGVFDTLAPKVYQVLVSYAQQQGYTLVLDVSQQQNPVLFAGDSTNITKAVIDAYNVKSGVPAPPAPVKPQIGKAAPPAH
ncbi:MAG: OmpH family outer membrane protein [Terracidiphilus sp.]